MADSLPLPKSIADLADEVVRELASDRPWITPGRERDLCLRLLEIMEDAAGWKSDPDEMVRLFREVIDGV